MLSRLIIKNYALIDDLELELGSGMSIITGQTGAGKSIMLGALSLLLGGRADTKAINHNDRKTIIEAQFSDGLIVRRELSPGGRSRAFVDDSPVTLQQLVATTSSLIDIHSQHATLLLNSRTGQLGIIDTFADNALILEQYRDIFHRFVTARNRIKELKEENARNQEMRSLLEYRLEILNKLNPKLGELEHIEHQYDLLSEADQIRSSLSQSHTLIDSENGALNNILEARNALSQINLSLIDKDSQNENGIEFRLHNIYIELKDIAESLSSMASEVESDPVALAKITNRMNALHEAKRQFKVSDADQLVSLREELVNKLVKINNADSDISDLELQARSLASQLKEKASQLTESRRLAAIRFAELLQHRARPLGLNNLKFTIDIQPGKLTSDGADNVEFQCSFNKNGSLLPMSKTASGGELSRLTLAIKSIMAEKMDMPTVIFDEIDTGVSGEIADKMGKMMGEMSSTTQILAITHLPQVASRGDRHYKVFKEDKEDRTVSHIRLLDRDERRQEIASMISGEKITDSALRTADELLKNKDNNK